MGHIFYNLTLQSEQTDLRKSQQSQSKKAAITNLCKYSLILHNLPKLFFFA